VLKNKIRILVAEDNVLNQLLAGSLLTQWGFTFDIVENGKLAIEKLKHKKYDLVLMDIQMPEMNGYDTAQFIRENMHLHLPIIAMTAHVLPGEKEKCISYGMTDYISKPIRENELYTLIAKYISPAPGKEKSGNNIHSSKNFNDKVANLDYVKELSNGNTVFVSQMIQLFLTENPVEIQRLESAIQQKDFKTIYTVAHKIKSTISFAGLDSKIKDELNEMEDLALKNNDLPKIELLFSKIKEICLKAGEELSNSQH
jgi:CheY-like chemotaxis protein